MKKTVNRQVWLTKKLKEICENFQKRKAPLGFTPYVEIGNVDVRSKKINFNNKGAVQGSFFAPAEAVLISRVRPTRGAIVFLNRELAVSPAFTVIKTKKEINPKLLFYFLAWNKDFFNYLGSRQKGTNYPSVRESDILDFEISFPKNENEQQKIVSILDTIQSAIEVQEKIMEKAKELKKSMMAELFKYGAPSFRKGRKLKKTEIGEIPENWDVVRLGEVVEKIQYGISKKGQREGEYPILRMNNLMEGQINTQDLQFVDLTKDEFDKFKLIKGDIIFNRTNSIELVGKTALFDLERDFVFASYLLRIRVNILKLLPQFLNWYFNWGKSQERLKKLASRGASQVNISATRLRTFQIPLPPLPEQREIAEILQTIDQKIEIEKKKKELYEELFKTMLNKIMNQEIDVEKIKI